jgi:cephalosporin hydroxylase
MNTFEQRITKKSNLEENDSLSCYQNHCAQQSHNAYKVFYDFINEHRPSRILEVGTGSGGFTVFLAMTCQELGLDTQIRSYDIYQPQWETELLQTLGVDLRIQNIFKGDFEDFDDEVKDFIQQPGITFVLCDGAYKPGEFRVLAPYIKPGDFIMCHDFAYDDELFESEINNKIWNWKEVTFAAIEQPVLQNQLTPYNLNIFQQAAWFCAIK